MMLNKRTLGWFRIEYLIYFYYNIRRYLLYYRRTGWFLIVFFYSASYDDNIIKNENVQPFSIHGSLTGFQAY